MAEGKNENKINLIVVTPYKNFYEGKVSSVTITTSDGEIGVMAGHSPLVVALKPGICSVRVDNEVKHFVCSEGYSEIGQKMALIICNSAEWPEDIDVKMACETYIEAKKELETLESNYSKDAEQKLNRAKARMHIVDLYGTDSQIERLNRNREKYGIN